MSVPYGAPQQQPPGQPGQAASPAVGLNLGLILPLVAAGLGLINYLLAFADDVPSSGPVEYLLAGALLAGLTALPKVPKGLLYAAAVLTVVPSLQILQLIIKSKSDIRGMEIVLLIVALLETAAVVLTILLDHGIVKFEPKPANPYGGQGQPGGWNPQSGAFPQQGQPQPGQQQQFGQQQFGQQPQQPQQPGQPPQQTSFMPQPGQFGQPGTPPGGFGGPQS
ncbi:hypothetical protein Lesp02_25890 [Lentzea sp. NBRC 105346]|uniref:DUF5336 domain-containing protein n=1 Tax=Lentzea sp. NBRC 105346 TaxID=3032205 RepID=UPI0025521F0A|nr:DUF5336 domain-containing protein [Lentzea sp. NBRC 105346]GLZ30400.1 hypothetical protein Lesp02_25890 [Lentzea sp. NBRC 105346]